jgi:hypothetical protein
MLFAAAAFHAKRKYRTLLLVCMEGDSGASHQRAALCRRLRKREARGADRRRTRSDR